MRVAGLLAAVIVYGAASVVNGRSVPLILDTDIGTFADDIYAIAYALNHPGLDLRLVVSTGTDPMARAKCAAKQLRMSGHADVPVAAGLPPSPEAVNATASSGDGFGEVDLLLDCRDTSSPDAGAISEDGVAAIADLVMSDPEADWAYVVIGPATTAARLAREYPAAAARVKAITLMAGSFCAGLEAYPGAMTPLGELNALLDVQSLRDVLSGAWGAPPAFAPVVLGVGSKFAEHEWMAMKKASGAYNLATAAMVTQFDEWYAAAMANEAAIVHGDVLRHGKRPGQFFDPAALALAAQLLGAEYTATYSIHVVDLPSVNITDSAMMTLGDAATTSAPCTLTDTPTSPGGGKGWKARAGLGFSPHGQDAYVRHLAGVLLYAGHGGVPDGSTHHGAEASSNHDLVPASTLVGAIPGGMGQHSSYLLV